MSGTLSAVFDKISFFRVFRALIGKILASGVKFLNMVSTFADGQMQTKTCFRSHSRFLGKLLDRVVEMEFYRPRGISVVIFFQRSIHEPFSVFEPSVFEP